MSESQSQSPGSGSGSSGNLEDFLNAFRMTGPGRPVDILHRAMIDDTTAQAVEEKRCIKAPMGCGQNLLDEDGNPRFVYDDRETAQLYYREWTITGLCGDCQDKVQATALELENGEEDECNGICLSASDIGVPASGIAYSHPDCPIHGEGASGDEAPAF